MGSTYIMPRSAKYATISWHSAGLDGSDKVDAWKLSKWFGKAAKEIDNEDTKFYFEQLQEYFLKYSARKGLEEPHKVLGL